MHYKNTSLCDISCLDFYPPPADSTYHSVLPSKIPKIKWKQELYVLVSMTFTFSNKFPLNRVFRVKVKILDFRKIESGFSLHKKGANTRFFLDTNLGS